MGDDFCRFIVGSGKQIQAAEFWLSKGATAREIIDKFQNNEIFLQHRLINTNV